MSDTIYREDAIRAVAEVLSLNRFASFKNIKDFGRFAERMLRNVPSADRPQGWIPCSERLPEIGQKVLASTKKTVFTQVYKGIYSDPKRWAWENNSVKRIEAWQPLPKLWKGADDDSDNV